MHEAQIILETDRLLLRTWKSEDSEPYWKINQDPKVYEFLRGPLSLQDVQEFIPEANRRHIQHGYTLWATELKQTHELSRFSPLVNHFFNNLIIKILHNHPGSNSLF